MKTIKIKSRTYSKYIFKAMYLTRIAIFIVAFTFIIASCKKFDPIEEQTNNSNLSNVSSSQMRDLVVSGNFDWKLFQTIDVNVVIPEGEKPKPIKISSLDGKKVYFKGYSEDGSNNIVTLVTIPSHVDMLLVQYSDGSAYEPVIVPVMNKTISYNFNSGMKMGGRSMDPECCDGKVTWLKLQYLDSDAIYIEVDGHGPGNNNLFTGNIVQGQVFTIYGNDNHNTLGSKVKVYKNNTNDKTEIHTSCSQDIYTGQTWDGDAGAYLIIDGESRFSGPLCQTVMVMTTMMTTMMTISLDHWLMKIYGQVKAITILTTL